MKIRIKGCKDLKFNEKSQSGDAQQLVAGLRSFRFRARTREAPLRVRVGGSVASAVQGRCCLSEDAPGVDRDYRSHGLRCTLYRLPAAALAGAPGAPPSAEELGQGVDA